MLRSKNKNLLVILLAGLFLGTAFSLFQNILFPMLLPLLFSIFISSVLKAQPWVKKAILAALWLRVGLSVAYYLYLSSIPLYPGYNFNGFMFGPDGELYSAHGWWISLLNTGKDILENNFIGRGGFIYDLYVLESYISKGIMVPMNSYQIGFVSYLYALIYSLFGYYPLIISFFNCILGVLIGYCAYLVALELFDKKIARITLFMVLFMPSLFVWSAFTKLKDPFYIFMLIFFILVCTRFVRQKKLSQFLFMLAILFASELVRKRSFYLVLCIFLFSLFLAVPLTLRRKITLLICILVFDYLVCGHTIINQARGCIYTLISYHRGSASSGGIVYWLHTDMYNVTDFNLVDYAVFYAKGLFHFFFEPLPTRLLTPSLLFFYIQQVFWDFMLIFVACGSFIVLKARKVQCLPMLFYFFIMSSSLALSGANIGTLARHRDAVTPIFVILFAVGITRLFDLKLNKPFEKGGSA